VVCNRTRGLKLGADLLEIGCRGDLAPDVAGANP
jgi:hypothetical protein